MIHLISDIAPRWQTIVLVFRLIVEFQSVLKEKVLGNNFF